MPTNVQRWRSPDATGTGACDVRARANRGRERLEIRRAEEERYELLRKIVSESQSQQDLKARVLRESTVVCGSLTAMENIFVGITV